MHRHSDSFKRKSEVKSGRISAEVGPETPGGTFSRPSVMSIHKANPTGGKQMGSFSESKGGSHFKSAFLQEY